MQKIIIWISAIFLAFSAVFRAGRQSVKNDENEKIVNQVTEKNKIIERTSQLSDVELDRKLSAFKTNNAK